MMLEMCDCHTTHGYSLIEWYWLRISFVAFFIIHFILGLLGPMLLECSACRAYRLHELSMCVRRAHIPGQLTVDACHSYSMSVISKPPIVPPTSDMPGWMNGTPIMPAPIPSAAAPSIIPTCQQNILLHLTRKSTHTRHFTKAKRQTLTSLFDGHQRAGQQLILSLSISVLRS